MTMKKCKHCSIELNENVKHEGYQCKTCRNGLARYGLNRNEQLELLKSQKYKCALCENAVELHVKNNQAGVIDHCHATGKIRGILCGACNVVLGQIELVGVDKFGIDKFIMNLNKYIELGRAGC